MSRPTPSSSHGASALAVSGQKSRPLRPHDLENPSLRSSKRSASPSATTVKNTTHKHPTAAEMHSALGSGNLDETENPDDDEDDGNSSSTPADGKEPEVKAPLHSTALNQTPAALMRVQAATAGLQNVLESAPAEEHGAGLRYDSLTDQPGPSSAKKRPLSDMQSSVNDEADLQDTHKTKSSRKKVRRHPANTDFATMSNKNMDENMDEDDNFDADMALLQRATNCEEDNAFVDDDDYDALDAISDSDPNEARDMTLLETLNIKKALADDPDSDLDSNFTTPKGPPTFDSVFDDFYRVPEFGDPTDPPLLSQQDDFLPDFSARPHRRNASDGSGRKVRFEDEVQISSQSSSTGSSEIRSEFPDILLAQDSLDAPPFPRGSIAAHRQLSPNGSDDSYWDVTDGYFQPDNVQVSEPSESSPGSSGYESEHSDTSEGETTDEELFVPTTISRPQSLLHQASSPSRGRRRRVSQFTELPPGQRSDVFIGQSPPRLPPRGTFRLKIHQPLALTHWEGTKTLMYNMGDPKCVCNSERNCINGKPKQVSNTQPPALQTPNTPAESMNLTFNSLVENEAELPPPGPVAGPFETFFPFYCVEADGTADHEQHDPFLDDGNDLDEDEMKLALDDFIAYGSNDSDEDEEMEDADFAFESPTSTSDQEPAATDDHLDRRNSWFGAYDSSTITSFRRNQDLARQVSRMPEHPNLRQSGQLANAYRQGRDAAADSLITPPRRRRGDGESSEAAALQM